MCYFSRTLSILEFCWKHLIIVLTLVMLTSVMPKFNCSPIRRCNEETVPYQNFSEYLSCPGSDTKIFTTTEKEAYRRQLLNKTDQSSIFDSIITCNRTTEELLQEHVSEVCRNSAIDRTKADWIEEVLKNENVTSDLLHLYHLFLNLSSDVHCIGEQELNSNAGSCRPAFQRKVWKLASRLADTACNLRRLTSTYSVQDSIFSEISQKVLNTKVCDNSSQRIMNECYTIKMTSIFLKILDSYLLQLQ